MTLLFAGFVGFIRLLGFGNTTNPANPINLTNPINCEWTSGAVTRTGAPRSGPASTP